MIEFLQGLAWWHWWIAAAVLAALETFLPGAIAIWFAAAALVVGALVMLVPVPWPLQLVLFGVLGVAALLIWRKLKQPEEKFESTQPALNQRGVQYIGRELTLVEPIRSGVGKVEVGDTVWLAEGGDAPAGSRVKVVGVNGAILKVEPV